MALDVTLHGPIFDGRSSGMAAQMLMAVRKTVAFAAMEGWQEGLSHTLRHPTGAYQSRLNIEKRGDALVLNDLRSVYGPWLEGTGSRNSPVTCFPGYFNARLVTAQINSQAVELARGDIDDYVDRLNHE
jgi:hypothetical protein